MYGCTDVVERTARGVLSDGTVMRAHERATRWLLLRQWGIVRGSKRRDLEGLFVANRRLFRASVLREQIDRLWMYKTRCGVLDFWSAGSMPFDGSDCPRWIGSGSSGSVISKGCGVL